MSHAAELVRELVRSFGDADAIVGLLAVDAQWWITPSVGVLGSPTVGRDEIRLAMERIFGEMYSDPSTEIHHVIADGDIAASRFTMRATALFADNRPYENEYSLWIQVRGSEIIRVWEYLDVAHVMSQLGLSSTSAEL